MRRVRDLLYLVWLYRRNSLGEIARVIRYYLGRR
jgi:hypothetical protein